VKPLRAHIVRGHVGYPYGPRDELEAIEAAKEVNSVGLLTGGPVTPTEWRHWQAAKEAGWQGRYCPPQDPQAVRVQRRGRK
jgi:hypothetical protein